MMNFMKECEMKIDEILNLWKEDCVIDKTEIGDEAIKIAKLHHKYFQDKKFAFLINHGP